MTKKKSSDKKEAKEGSHPKVPHNQQNGDVLSTTHIALQSENISTPAEKIKPNKPLEEKYYLNELARLHVELVKLQEWIRFKGLKLVVIFEGRDAAGKGGTIKRITESLNPRICRVVALP